MTVFIKISYCFLCNESKKAKYFLLAPTVAASFAFFLSKSKDIADGGTM
jgi:hypothetical protein